MADETGLDFTDQINLLESKYQEVCIFKNLSWILIYATRNCFLIPYN